MPRPEFRATFENGEFGEDWLRRADTEQLPRACRRLRNHLLKAGGGTKRRPGTNELAVLQGQARHYAFHGQSATEYLVFTNARLDVYAADGTLNQSITSSIPWVTADLARLQFTADADKVFVFHQSFMPQVLTRASDGTWSRADFSFLSGIISNPAQPFYDKFDDIDVAMALSAYTGSGVTMTFSSAVLNTDSPSLHVGTRFRYMTRCEVEVTAVASATSATVTVRDALYPTLDVTVGDSSGYKVGHAVKGSISLVEGVVSSIPSGTVVRVILAAGYERFQVITTTGVDKDRLVGPESNQEITNVSTVSTPASTTIWDEQLISPVRGYPSTGRLHRKRMFMAGFPQATSQVVASSINNFYDFTIATDPDSAINESLGDDPNAEIRHLVSAEQFLLFTDRGVYYVPESDGNITTETIAFLRVGPEGSAYADPVLASEGVLFIDEDAGRLMACVPTGNVRRSWQIAELSEYGYDTLNAPVRMAVANGLDGRTERYVFVLNGDGTLAVMMYRRASENVGFAKWYRGTGTWTDIAAIEDDVSVISKIGSVYRLGEFKFAALCDDEADYSSTVSGRNGDEVELVKNRCVVATDTVASGSVPVQAAAAGYTLGYDFETILEPASPLDGQSGWRRMRIVSARYEVYQSGAFKVGNRSSWPFGATDDLETVGTVSDRVVRGFQLGWSGAPVQPITQPKGEGALLEVRAVTMEVS